MLQMFSHHPDGMALLWYFWIPFAYFCMYILQMIDDDRCAIDVRYLRCWIYYIATLFLRNLSPDFICFQKTPEARNHEKSPAKKVQGWHAASHRPADRCLPGEAAPATGPFIAGGCPDPSEGWSPSKSAQHGGAVVGSTWGGCHIWTLWMEDNPASG